MSPTPRMHIYFMPAPPGPASKSLPPRAHRVVVAVVPPVDELDLVGPLQVFSSVNRLARRPIYSVEVLTSNSHRKVQGENGVVNFLAHGSLYRVRRSLDSVLLVCGLGTRRVRDPRLFAWLKGTAPRVRRLGAVCVGAFLLAEAGLLDGKKATAHWKFGQELAKRYPRVSVQSEPLWVKDGNIYTSAGISAGIDLALAWVEEDCGGALAHEAARELVLFLRRPAGQPQLSVSLAAQASEMHAIHELQLWITQNLNRKLFLPFLAQKMSMSVRNFERLFIREVGTTAIQYILRCRVEAARLQLERTEKGLKQVASAVGFSSVDVMRRAFVRLTGLTPKRFRDQPARVHLESKASLTSHERAFDHESR